MEGELKKPQDLERVAPRLDLKLGFACNNRCRFCVQGRKREKHATRPQAELIDFLKRHRDRYQALVLTGGEPCLRPELPELIATAVRLGYKSIQVQSNGRMFAYRKYCETLIDAGATEFSPALHGHNAACHDYLTRAQGSFDQTLAGIRHLKALGQKVVTNSVITRSNFRHLLALTQLLRKLRVDQFQLAFVHPLGSAGPAEGFDALVARMEMLKPHLNEALAWGREQGMQGMCEAVPLCVLRPDLRSFAAETIMPQTRILDAEGEIPDYTSYRLSEGKAKGPDCRRCRLDDSCEGPWREYPERFGWSEFKAVTS